MRRRFGLYVLLCVLVLSVAIVLGEVLLRAIGFKPWRYTQLDANEPTMHEPDPVLGWRNKKGVYIVPPYHPSGEAIHVTFLDNGQRRTTERYTSVTEGEILIVGGSYTQGWAISDHETFPWKLEDYYPFLTVLNYGTGGYGSYQSLLKLEHELPQARSPKIVLYGFIDQHQVRNVAPGGWLRIMSLYSRRGHVDVPFATIGENNELIRQPPEAYPSWPFRQSSSVITLVERVFMKFKTRKRKSQKIQVTEKILLQMNSISEKYGAKFYMVLLHVTDKTKRHYIKFLNEYNIEFIDCSFDLSDQMIVPGESHPNGKMNALWSQCIKTRLDTQIDTITTSSRHFERNAKNSGVLHDRLRRKQM